MMSSHAFACFLTSHVFSCLHCFLNSRRWLNMGSALPTWTLLSRLRFFIVCRDQIHISYLAIIHGGECAGRCTANGQ
ncbi:hypothetical protein C8R48DRAFT_836786 [Suillus tomentosus]|nr:hypothetical protein C8R48DRAFT_836786 [Suillus tomentosus]